MDGMERVRVNISLTTESRDRLKRLAGARGCSVSRLVADYAAASEGTAPGRTWLMKISPDTLERIEQYAYEHHTSPEQAVADWAWNAKVSYASLRGQMSLFQ